MESLWVKKLRSQGWPKRAILQFPQAWAPTTRKQYEQIINRLHSFCVTQGYGFPPVSTACIVDYLCHTADQSSRPESVLKCASAAITWLFKAKGLPNLVQDEDVQKLMSALVKSGTQAPRCRSKVMPVSPFTSLFESWPDAEELSIQDLRLKTVCLLALCIMLRPSDVAPNSVLFDPTSEECVPLLFSTDHIAKQQDGSLVISFLGIKNDYKRQGFNVVLPPASNKKLDPVDTLEIYIRRTASLRRQVSGNPVFLTLTKPLHQLSSRGVAQVLNITS